MDNHDAVVTHLEPNILEHEVKCCLEKFTTIKDSGGDGITGEEFKILTDDAVEHRSVHSVVPNSLQPHESQHERPPCTSPTPGVYSNSCPSNR